MSRLTTYGVFKDGKILAVLQLPGPMVWQEMEDGVEVKGILLEEYDSLIEKFKKRQELGLYP